MGFRDGNEGGGLGSGSSLICFFFFGILEGLGQWKECELVVCRFRGFEDVKVDVKGCVLILVKFCCVFEFCDFDWQVGKCVQLIIVFGMCDWKYFQFYIIQVMDEIDEGILQMLCGSVECNLLENLYYGYVEEVEIDGDGCLVLL